MWQDDERVMSITVTYNKIGGTQEQTELEESVTEIDLTGRGIEHIDLSPLSQCRNLKVLRLDDNYLRHLDLSALSTSSKLEEMSLQDNRLQSIDLGPLGRCTALRKLNLRGNKLNELDLHPLATCSQFEDILLANSGIESVDLTPVYRLRHLDGSQAFSSVLFRATSWLRIRSLSPDRVEYERPTRSYDWPFLRSVIQDFAGDRLVQQDILRAISLEDYGFIDVDFSEDLLSIPADATLETARQQIIPRLLEEIVGAVERGGLTTGLRLEKLIHEHGELAVNAEKIVEARNRELELVRVGVRDEVFDLRELAVTAYGYELISAAGVSQLLVHLVTWVKKHRVLADALAKLGHEFVIAEEAVPGVQMSYELKRAIWFILENQGKVKDRPSDSKCPRTPPYP